MLRHIGLVGGLRVVTIDAQQTRVRRNNVSDAYTGLILNRTR